MRKTGRKAYPVLIQLGIKKFFTKMLRQYQVDWSGRRETPSGTARVRRSTWETKYSIPKLAEAVPEESERSGAEIHTIQMTKFYTFL
ncbi:hypothetical protein JOD43_000457 [Pullulanibacillus pueri]|nr:hypothetical protein [Pullulanibacillus pueri]